MVFYKVLSDMTPYKGLYPSEPFPPDGNDTDLIGLWDRYIHYLEPLENMGITDELSIDELKELAKIMSERCGTKYEVICFGSTKKCPDNSVYYGVDVASKGGYSLLGDGLFNCKCSSPLPSIFKILNSFFRDRLNQYGLFENEADAELFMSTLMELNSCRDGIVEPERWYKVHVFGI